MKRLLLAAACAAFVATGAWAQGAKPVSLVVPVGTEARTLSPDFVADPGSYIPASNIYSSLVTMDWGVLTGTSAYGDLAKSWEYSPDLLTLTFHLHDTAKWHDGVPVTSEDVTFTFQRMIDKKYRTRPSCEMSPVWQRRTRPPS